MPKTIKEMQVEDFRKVPYRESWNSEVAGFNSLVIVPTGEMHPSGYMMMDFVAVNDEEFPICRMSGISDTLEINGIGGYGERGIGKWAQPHSWTIDCLPCGLLRLFSDHNALKAGWDLSSFEVFYMEKES